MHIFSLVREALVTLAVAGISNAAFSGSSFESNNAQSAQLLNAAPDDLRLLSNDAFTVLGHSAFPRHSVRVKKSDFCDETVAYVPHDCVVPIVLNTDSR